MPRTRATQPRRKGATSARAFLFSDLRDYTSFVEAKGDAAAARLLREYRTLVRREVARHDGGEVKTEGDSFYVVFDSASSALECAVAILRAADAQNGRDPASPLRIGVGLHAGETVEYDDQFVGSAVNIASRLAGKAGAMELLISDTLRGLVRTSQSLPMSERGALELKGVTERIRAWSVDWREPEPAHAPTPAAAPATDASPSAPALAVGIGQLLCPIVVGRSAETSKFADALAAAVAGRGQTIVLAGEAGVGKTKFVRDAQTRAAAAGARTLLGLTRQSDGALPYAPFISAIRSGFHGLERDELGRVLQRSAPDLAELFPELGRLARASTPTGLERHRLTVAFQHLFRAFAREAPVLLVLEDLHWADETSLELLQHLARELRDARVVILATYRSDEMHRRHPFLRTLAELQRERLVNDIALKRLTPEETGELMHAAFAATDPTVTVSNEFRDAIYARSEGNPFFTEELLKALVESGGVFWREGDGWARKPIAELEIPGTIREAVRARVERLSDPARETLSAAAIIGQRFSFDVLREVRHVEERALEGEIREFIEQQLVSEASGRDDEYAFRHALTREVVYDDLLVRERRRLHRAVADALAAAGDTEPAILGHHLLAAGELQRAAPVLVEAGDRALRTGAPREAVAHYARAAEIGMADELLASIFERQADAYLAFDTTLSIKSAQEASALYREVGDRRGLSRVLRLEGRGLFYEGKADGAEQRTQEAIDVLEGEVCVELARAVAQLAGLLMARTAMSEAIPIADRAIEMGERLNDPWTLANALITRGSSMRGSAAASFLRRGLDVALQNGLYETAGRGYNNSVIQLLQSAAPWQERAEVIKAGLEYERRHGHERAIAAYLLSSRLVTEFGQGDWDAALATASEMHVGSNAYRWVIRTRADVTSAREGAAAALPIYRELAETLRQDPAERLLNHADLAQALAAAGRMDEAREQLSALETLALRFVAGEKAHDTPRSRLAGPGLEPMLAVAVRLDEPRWVDLVEEELREDVALVSGQRLYVAAARAILARDATAAAAALEAAYPLWARVGFTAYWHGFALKLANVAVERGIELGPEWRAIFERCRAFAEKAGARSWLADLERLQPR